MIFGILIALVAVYLTSKKEGNLWDRKKIALPLIAFLGSGTVDTSLQYIQIHFVKPEEIILFSAHTFGVAFVLGMLFFLVKNKSLLLILSYIVRLYIYPKYIIKFSIFQLL